MGNVLADNAYANLNKVVQYIHNQVYKGTRDRNRYQLTHGIYVWWEAGKITKIFECVTNRKLEFKQDKIAVENNCNNFGNIINIIDSSEDILGLVTTHINCSKEICN